MIYLNRLFNWLKEPGYLYLFPIFILAHIVGVTHFERNQEIFNIYASAFFQCIGISMVLFAINSNLNILSSGSIKSSVFSWFKRIPFRSKENNMEFSSIASSSSICSVELTVPPKMETLEEQVSFLLKEIDRLDVKINKQTVNLEEKIYKETSNIKSEINTHGQQIVQLNSKVNEVVVGGVKLEILGILCVFYGIVIPAWYA